MNQTKKRDKERKFLVDLLLLILLSLFKKTLYRVFALWPHEQ